MLEAMIASKTSFALPFFSLQPHYFHLLYLEAAFILHCFWLSGLFIRFIFSFSNLSNIVRMLALHRDSRNIDHTVQNSVMEAK